MMFHGGLALFPAADACRYKLSAFLFKRQHFKNLFGRFVLKSLIHFYFSSVCTEAVNVPFLYCFFVQ